MTHGSHKEQKKSLAQLLFSSEALLVLVGVALMVYGVSNGTSIIIFWACVIIPGAVILHLVRRKDWTKHWEEMEAEHKLREEYEARRKAAADEARKGDNDQQ